MPRKSTKKVVKEPVATGPPPLRKHSIQVSYSKLSTWRRCRQRFAWHYIDHMRPASLSVGLRRGSAGHNALAEWYKILYLSGRTAADDSSLFDEAREAAVRKLRESWLATQAPEDQFSLSEDRQYHALETVIRRYMEWAEYEDDWQRVVAVEQPFYLELPGGNRLIAIVDLLVVRGGELWILDHKFMTNITSNHLGLDAQITTYMAAIRQAYPDTPPAGVIYNQISTRTGGIAVERPVVRTQVRRTEIGARLALNEVAAQASELQGFFSLPEEEQRMFAYRNPTRDCHWDCPYYTACLMTEQDGNPAAVFETPGFVSGKAPEEAAEDGESGGTE